MSTTNVKNRNISGGVVGGFTPVRTTLDCAGVAVGDTLTGLKIPKGKFCVGVYFRNPKNDLTSGGSATLQIKLGTTGQGSATAIASLKGSGSYLPLETPLYASAETDVKLTVAVAGLTAGTLEIGAVYA